MVTYFIGDLSRRELLMRSAVLVALLVLAGVIFLPGAVAHAQDHQADKVYRIGFLRAGPPPKAWVDSLQQGLRERGYIVGQNVVIEFRCTDGSLDQIPQFAEDLVRSKVDVIVASSSPAAVPAKKAVDIGAYRLCKRVRSVGDRTSPELGAPRGQRDRTVVHLD